MNWDEAVEAMKAEMMLFLYGQAGQIVGDVADMETFATETAQDLMEALAQGRDDLADEIKAQLRVRAEVLRLKGTQAFWSTINVAIGLTMKTAFGLLKAQE